MDRSLTKASVPARNTDAPRLPQPIALPAGACEICKGAGWLRNDVPYGHHLFGKLAKCQCRKSQEVESRCYTWLGESPGHLPSLSFARFEWAKQPKAFHAMKSLADRFVAGERELPNALLLGSPGLGKTHLACALLNTLRKEGIACLYCTAQAFFERLYASMRNETDAREVWLKSQFCATPLLVIDELDKLHVKIDANGRSFQKETLTALLDARYRAHLPTILISNETVNLDRWLDASTLDRLYEHCLPLSATSMTGTSYRQRAGRK